MTALIKVIGLLGGAAFSYAALPTAIATWKQGKSLGTPISIAWAIMTGTVFMLSYLLFTYGCDWVVITNLSAEFLTWLVIIKFHYFPRT